MSAIGHNSGNITAALALTYGKMMERRDALLQSMERVPAKIENDETQKKVGDLAVMLMAQVALTEKAREDEKAPFIANGKAIDAFFNTGIKNPLLAAHMKLADMGTEYLRAKRHQVEQARLAEISETEERARAAADAASTMQEQGFGNVAAKLTDEAIEAGETAHRLSTALSQTKAADHVRTRSDSGALSTLRETLVCTEYDLQTLDYEALRGHFSDDANRKAINSFIKANKSKLASGSLTLAGATITAEARAQYRR